MQFVLQRSCRHCDCHCCGSNIYAVQCTMWCIFTKEIHIRDGPFMGNWLGSKKREQSHAFATLLIFFLLFIMPQCHENIREFTFTCVFVEHG